jgi:hypothetical protein
VDLIHKQQQVNNNNMKRLMNLTAALLLLACTSCMAQKTDSLAIGKMTGYVVADSEKGLVIDNPQGHNLILDGELEVGVEYEIVYKILSRGDRVITGQLIKAEHSARENAKRRAALAEFLY